MCSMYSSYNFSLYSYILMQVISEIEGMLNILGSTSTSIMIPELDQVAVAISFILRDSTAPNDIVNTVEGALPQFNGDPSFGVLAFQPSGKTIF